MNDLLRAFKNIFNFSGRATRKEFIFFVFIYFILTRILLFFIIFTLPEKYPSIDFYSLTDLMGKVDALFIRLPILFIFIRRSHDIGISGGLAIFIYLLNISYDYDSVSDYITSIYDQLIDYLLPYEFFMLIVNVGLFIYLACHPSDVENEYGQPISETSTTTEKIATTDITSIETPAEIISMIDTSAASINFDGIDDIIDEFKPLYERYIKDTNSLSEEELARMYDLEQMYADITTEHINRAGFIIEKKRSLASDFAAQLRTHGTRNNNEI